MTRKDFNRLAEAVRAIQSDKEFTPKQIRTIILQITLACKDLAKSEFDRAKFENACKI